MARYFIPSTALAALAASRSTIKLMFSRPALPLVFRWFGAKSVLEGYS